jgi:hypothetical protein
MQGRNVLSQLVAVDGVTIEIEWCVLQLLMRAFQRGCQFEQATVFVFVGSAHLSRIIRLEPARRRARREIDLFAEVIQAVLGAFVHLDAKPRGIISLQECHSDGRTSGSSAEGVCAASTERH